MERSKWIKFSMILAILIDPSKILCKDQYGKEEVDQIFNDIGYTYQP